MDPLTLASSRSTAAGGVLMAAYNHQMHATSDAAVSEEPALQNFYFTGAYFSFLVHFYVIAGVLVTSPVLSCKAEMINTVFFTITCKSFDSASDYVSVLIRHLYPSLVRRDISLQVKLCN